LEEALRLGLREAATRTGERNTYSGHPTSPDKLSPSVFHSEHFSVEKVNTA
jgi:hypothetical protein